MALAKRYRSKAKLHKIDGISNPKKVKGKTAVSTMFVTKLIGKRLKPKSHREAANPNIWIEMADPEKVGTLKFGRVIVANIVPDSDTLRTNIEAGRQALKRATEVLNKPGIKLHLAADVPKFRFDTSQPGMLVRELNGAVQRGRIVNGTFVPAD